MPYSIIFDCNIDDILEILKKNNFLTQEVEDLIRKHNDFNLINQIFNIFIDKDIFDLENIKWFLEYPDINQIAETINILYENQLLTKENIEWIKEKSGHYSRHPTGRLEKFLKDLSDSICHLFNITNPFASEDYDRSSIHFSLKILNNDKILNEEIIKLVKERDDQYINLISNHPYPKDMASALLLLKDANSLDEQYINLIRNHYYPKYMASALLLLKDANLLDEQYINLVDKHTHPSNMAKGLLLLKDANLLDEQYINLISNKCYPDLMAIAFQLLKDANLLDEQYINLIRNHHYPKDMASALLLLKDANLLDEQYINLIRNHPHPEIMASTLLLLKDASLLDDKYINLIRNHPYSKDRMALALLLLKDANSLDEQYINLIRNHHYPKDMASALLLLKDANSLDEQYINLISNHPYPKDMASALLLLKDANSLDEQYINLIRNHYYPKYMASALLLLKDANLLDDKYINLIRNHPHPEIMASTLLLLKNNGILNEENINLIKNSFHKNMIYILISLNNSNLLNKDNFEKLFNPRYKFFIKNERICKSIYHLSNILFTQDVFNELIEYSIRPNAEQIIIRYIYRLQRGELINHPQSTHTASINHSASASARKLYERYGKEISDDKLDSIILKIQKYISSLPDKSQINLAAKRCINRVTQVDYSFEDPTSKISIRQLLALTYLALIDSDLCTATLEDALQLFVQGLYETQRDGNLSEEGFDNSDKIDKFICPAGTFNKLLEKVNGVHPDIELTFINLAIATHKLPVVVCEEVDKYLQERSSPKDFKNSVCLIESLKIEGVEVIWSEIESKINKRLFDEFGVLFKDENDPDFKMFIDAGKYTPIDDLLSSYEEDLVHPSSSSQTVRASFFTPKDKDQKVERRTENSNSMATENNITLN